MFGLTTLFMNFAIDCGAKPTFFGLLPWYNYLSVTSQTPTNGPAYCKVTFQVLGGQSSFLLIGLAVLDDLLRVAGLVAVGYVIWGGFKYMTSQGSPDGTKQAQQTVVNSLIGLVLAIMAVTIVGFVGSKIAGP